MGAMCAFLSPRPSQVKATSPWCPVFLQTRPRHVRRAGEKEINKSMILLKAEPMKIFNCKQARALHIATFS
jgi:hypothetical protein